MENENIGILLHKFTKYQTLLANSKSKEMDKIYNEKIKYYRNKLEKLGINHSTLVQMGGLFKK